jgi:hypothetical protein
MSACICERLGNVDDQNRCAACPVRVERERERRAHNAAVAAALGWRPDPDWRDLPGNRRQPTGDASAMRLVPTFDDLASAQSAINSQHPSLSDDAPATTLANETDGTGRRVLRVTTQQLATLTHGLALTHFLARGGNRWRCPKHGVVELDPLADGSMHVIAGQPDRVCLRTCERLDPRDVCWHCHVCLEPAPRHCESCPPEGECDVEGCDQPGCEGRATS